MLIVSAGIRSHTVIYPREWCHLLGFLAQIILVHRAFSSIFVDSGPCFVRSFPVQFGTKCR